MCATRTRIGRRKPRGSLTGVQGTISPTGQIIGIPAKKDLESTLDLLGIPIDIATLIADAKFETSDGDEIFLFKANISVNSPSDLPENLFRFKTELSEIISVYDYYIDENGEEDGSVMFKDYLKTLILSQTKKSREDTRIKYDTVFEAPYLAEHRRLENIKNIMESRKRTPVSGINCLRSGCKSTDAYLTDKQVRSGDEPSTTFYECEKCGYEWKK